jgi:hypothetical protein
VRGVKRELGGMAKKEYRVGLKLIEDTDGEDKRQKLHCEYHLVDKHGKNNRRTAILVRQQCFQAQRRREERRGFIIRLVV